jgi:hypothetical protein
VVRIELRGRCCFPKPLQFPSASLRLWGNGGALSFPVTGTATAFTAEAQRVQQRQATASNGKQRQATASNGKQRQATASNGNSNG